MLTVAQHTELIQALLALRADLQKLLDDANDGSKPVSIDTPIGRLSRMDAIQQQNMSQANRRSAQQRLARVEAALRRCDNDEYGLCLDCDEPIGYARLKARPDALFCINCQTDKESGRL